AVPSSSPKRITSTSGCSKVQLLIAFRWITLLWPSNGFGVEKMVNILDPSLSRWCTQRRARAILAGIVELSSHWRLRNGLRCANGFRVRDSWRMTGKQAQAGWIVEVLF